MTVFGIVRCYYVGQASQKDQTCEQMSTSQNLALMLMSIAGTASEGAIWSQVEISVGIISACLPVYRPLFMRRAQPSYAAHSAKTYTGKPGRGSGSIPLYSKKRGFDLWSTIKSHDEPEDVETGSLVNLRDAGNSQVGKAHIAGQT